MALISCLKLCAQLPIIPQVQLVYGNIKSVENLSGNKDYAEYDPNGRLTAYRNDIMNIKIIWEGNGIRCCYADNKDDDPTYQYSYVEVSNDESLAWFSGAFRWTNSFDSHNRLLAGSWQSVIIGGHKVGTKFKLYYDSEDVLFPAKRVETPGDQTYSFNCIEKDDRGNAIKYSVLFPDGHTEMYERVIEYY